MAFPHGLLKFSFTIFVRCLSLGVISTKGVSVAVVQTAALFKNFMVELMGQSLHIHKIWVL